MFNRFCEIEEYILKQDFKATIALAGSHDDDALSAVVNARRKGIINALLIGDEAKTKELLRQFDEPADDYCFIDEADEKECARRAVELVNEGQADMPMKGLMQTATYLKAILDKEKGFVPEKGLISVINIYESKLHKKFLTLTDCAINIAPDYSDKVKILKNAVRLSHQLGNKMPKVAVVTPVEVINPVMQSTIDAAMLSKAAERGQIKGCIVDGPLGLDNAISKEAAEHKGIVSPVAGDADIVLFPELASANMFTKGWNILGDGSISAGSALGTTKSVVMTSRSDSAVNKYNSILIGALRAINSEIV